MDIQNIAIKLDSWMTIDRMAHVNLLKMSLASSQHEDMSWSAEFDSRYDIQSASATVKH